MKLFFSAAALLYKCPHCGARLRHHDCDHVSVIGLDRYRGGLQRGYGVIANELLYERLRTDLVVRMNRSVSEVAAHMEPSHAVHLPSRRVLEITITQLYRAHNKRGPVFFAGPPREPSEFPHR